MLKGFFLVFALALGLNFCCALEYTIIPKVPNQEEKELMKESKAKLKEMKISLDGASFVKYINKGDVQIVKLFLDGGIGANYSYYGVPALFYAAKSNHYEIAKLLIDNGAKVTRGFESHLEYAIKNKNYQMAKLLVENGAEVNYNTFFKDISLLNLAISKKEFQTVKLLLNHGAKPDNLTPYYIKRSSKEIQELFKDQF